MRIKLFEDFKDTSDDTYVDLIKSIWGVDPYEFHDILLSELSGDVGFLYFSFLYPTPSKDCEICPCLQTDGVDIKKAPWYDNIKYILDSNKYSIIIEVFSTEDSDIPVDEINSRLSDMGIPYKMENPDKIHGRSYLQFIKTT